MEMHQIRYFVALTRTMNFTRAAEECNVTQPALSRAIHALEAEVGGDLLTREQSLSHLTPLGQRLLPLLRQSYDSAVAAKDLAKAIKNGEASTLDMTVSTNVNLGLIAPAISQVSAAFPGVQLRLNRGSDAEVEDSLKSGRAELGIGPQPDKLWERIDSWPLFSEPFGLTVNQEHGLARRNRIEMGQLKNERLLCMKHCGKRETILRRLAENGVSIAGAHEVATDSDLFALLEANLGVTIAPPSLLRSERLRSLAIEGLNVSRTVAVYGVAGRRRAPAATAMLNLLRASDWSRHSRPSPRSAMH